MISSGFGERAIGDDHALPHPPESSVRVGAQALPVDADEIEHVGGARERLPLGDPLVRAHHVHELVADAHHRVEGVHGALEDHGDVAPAELPQLLLLLACRCLAAEEDAAAGNVAGRAEDLHDRARHRRLAAAGLPREPEDLAGADVESIRRLLGYEAPEPCSTTSPRSSSSVSVRVGAVAGWDSIISVFIVPERAFARGGRAPSASCAAASRSAAWGC